MKKFKWNWGWSLLTVFVLFVIIFSYVFYLSIKHLKNDELFEENYYEAELKYGEILDQKHRADTMRIAVKIHLKKNGIQIQFPPYYPPEKVEGTLTLYRPNKKLFDKNIPVNLDSNRMLFVPGDSLLPGRWDIHLKWKLDSLGYYLEKPIMWQE